MILSGIACVAVSLIPAGTERTGNYYAAHFLNKKLSNIMRYFVDY